MNTFVQCFMGLGLNVYLIHPRYKISGLPHYFFPGWLWCSPSCHACHLVSAPKSGCQAIYLFPKQNYPFQTLLRKCRWSSTVFRAQPSLPGLAFKNAHNSLSAFFPHACFLHFFWCSLGANHLVFSILGSCKTELREHHLPGLRNPWQCLAHSGIRKCLLNGQSVLILWDSYF